MSGPQVRVVVTEWASPEPEYDDEAYTDAVLALGEVVTSALARLVAAGATREDVEVELGSAIANALAEVAS